MDAMTLTDVLTMFRRRRRALLLTSAIVFALCAALTFSLTRYRATATIEIEQPTISSTIAGADNTLGLADRRISQVEQKVTANDSLGEIISELNLYPSAKNPAATAERMRRDIALTFVGSTLTNPIAAQKESVEQLSAIAFTLSFTHSDPALAKAALDVLIDRFITQEAAMRATAAKQTSDFLDAELNALATSIDEQQTAIAQFRTKNGESGPTALAFNQKASLDTSANLQNVESAITTNAGLTGTLRSQLAATDPYLPIVENGKTINSPAGQLKALQAQYASLIGRYGDNHPDVIRVRQQLKALKTKGIKPSAGVKRDADNPTYLQLSTQLASAQAQHKALLAERKTLKAQAVKYTHSIAKNPQIEQQMAQLSLDLDNSKERYRDLKAKKLTADMQQNLERDQASLQLRVLNPASVPVTTTPPRALLLLASFLLALLSGALAALIAEARTQSLRGANHLADLVGAAPLATIPHIAREAA